MTAPVTASERDLRALAAIVSEDRPDLPDGHGLPPSLLTDLMGQIRCDMLSLDGWDTGRQMCWLSQERAIVKTCGSRSLSCFRLGVLAGPFDEFAVDEGRSGADQGDEVGRVDRAPAILR
jgi:hypothetical protein